MNVFAKLAVGATLACVLAAACGGGVTGPKLPPPGSAEPDKFLFDHGNEAMAKKHWYEAREYYKAIVERYPQSPLRPDAKLAVGDTLIAENTPESKVLAVNEFTEFLSFFPTHPRADYAQLKVAYAHYKQMLGPQRDQSETEEALRQYDLFIKRYPNSKLMPEAQQQRREVRDRLSESEFEVGRFYSRIQWCPGAVERLDALLKDDPDFTNKDAVYFYLAQCYDKAKQYALALPYYDRIVKEFTKSDYLDKAKKRSEELKPLVAAAPVKK